MSDSEEVINVAPAPAKKVRMPRTPAQIAATQRGLEALARRRAENALAKEKAVAEKPVAKRVDPKPDPGYFTPDMLEMVKHSVREEIQKERSERSRAKPVAPTPYPPAPVETVKMAKPKRRVVVVEDSSTEEEEVIVKRRVPKAPKPSTFAVPESRVTSGSDLLDSIFFR